MDREGATRTGEIPAGAVGNGVGCTVPTGKGVGSGLKDGLGVVGRLDEKDGGTAGGSVTAGGLDSWLAGFGVATTPVTKSMAMARATATITAIPTS